jgi:hypothetical protein
MVGTLPQRGEHPLNLGLKFVHKSKIRNLKKTVPPRLFSGSELGSRFPKVFIKGGNDYSEYFASTKRGPR